MSGKTEATKNAIYYSGSYFKSLNGNKYGNYRQATKTIKVKGRFEDIYNYIEENIHMWIGAISPVENTTGLSDDMIERMAVAADQAQKMAVRKEVGKKFCHYVAADKESDLIDVTVIKGFLFFKTKVVLKLNGYAGYCKQMIKVIEEKVKKFLEQK